VEPDYWRIPSTPDSGHPLGVESLFGVPSRMGSVSSAAQTPPETAHHVGFSAAVGSEMVVWVRRFAGSPGRR
jgi:hypothetical protein